MGVLIQAIDGSAVTARTKLADGTVVPAGLFHFPDGFGFDISFLFGIVDGGTLGDFEVVEALDATATWSRASGRAGTRSPSRAGLP